MTRLQKGFSLVELMIAITIGLVLMTGVVQMFLSSKTVFTTQQGLSRVQETGRLAVDFMARDIRESGFYGCARPTAWNLFNTLKDSNKFGRDFDIDNWLQVFKPKSVPDEMKIGDAPNADTPVVALYGANGDSVSVVAMNTESEVYVEPVDSGDASCPGGFCKTNIVAATDCEKIWIFEVTDSAQKTIASHPSEVVALAHDESKNKKYKWGGIDNSVAGRIDKVVSEVYKIEPSIYFIRNNTAGRPTLWRKEGGSPPYELLEGVENIDLEFGLDSSGGDFIVDEYVKFDDMKVAQWAEVAAVRLHLLVQSPEDNVAPEPQTYTFAGKEVEANDRRIRQVFTSTVGIRPRLN